MADHPERTASRTIRDILNDVRKLAVEYRTLTGKPLGVTGEVAEFYAAEKLGLELVEARTPGYDAIDPRDGRRVQIKGRRVSHKSGRVGKIDLLKEFDTVVLVLLDEDFEVTEIWEAGRAAVKERLERPGSKARNERGSLGISQFCSIATRVWPERA